MEVYYRKFELINDSLRKLEEIKKENPSLERYRNSWKDKDSAERNLQKTIEAIIDLGKMLVADKGLREPGNNREVFLILEENNLFPIIIVYPKNIIFYPYACTTWDDSS